MEAVVATQNRDAINGAAFILLKYILEVSLEAAAEKISPEDEFHDILERAAAGPVNGDDLSRILMGYCMAEEGAMESHLAKALSILGTQALTLKQSIGGQ